MPLKPVFLKPTPKSQKGREKVVCEPTDPNASSGPATIAEVRERLGELCHNDATRSALNQLPDIDLSDVWATIRAFLGKYRRVVLFTYDQMEEVHGEKLQGPVVRLLFDFAFSAFEPVD